MPKPQSNEVEWTAEILTLLGQLPDSALAIRMGSTSMQVRRKRIELGIAAWNATLADKLVKERQCSSGWESGRAWLNRSSTTESSKVQVATNDEYALQEAVFEPPAQHEWTDLETNLLGTMPDESLAAILGIDVKEVRFMRIKLFINVYQPDTKGY